MDGESSLAFHDIAVLYRFVNAVTLMHETDVIPEPQRVALLTLHVAKGLELL